MRNSCSYGHARKQKPNCFLLNPELRCPIFFGEGLRAGWLAAGKQCCGRWLAIWAIFVPCWGPPINCSLMSGPCVRCKCAGTAPATRSDFSSTAAWRATRSDAEDWRQWGRRTKCHLLTLPGHLVGPLRMTGFMSNTLS